MFWTGLRLGEAQGLKWKNYADGKFQIVEALSTQVNEGKSGLTDPKTPYSVREILLDDKSIKLLETRKKEEMECGYFDENWYICGREKPLARSTINRRRKDTIKKLDLKYITNHQMRHSHGSFLLAAGASLANISRRLGHSNVNITADFYIHPIDDGDKKITQIISESSHKSSHGIT